MCFPHMINGLSWVNDWCRLQHSYTVIVEVLDDPSVILSWISLFNMTTSNWNVQVIGSSSCSSTVIILTDYRWTLSERDAKEFVLQAPTFKKVNKRISFGIPVLVIRTPRVGNIQVYNSCLMQCHQNWAALHFWFVSVELFTEHAYSINSGPVFL